MVMVKPVPGHPDPDGLAKVVPPDNTDAPIGGLIVVEPICVIMILKSQGAGAQAVAQNKGVTPGESVMLFCASQTLLQLGSAAYQSTIKVQVVLFLTL